MIIILAGLVVVEKLALVRALTAVYAGRGVRIIDNGARLALDADDWPAGVPVIRVESAAAIPAALAGAEVALVALDETTTPDDLSALTDQIYDTIPHSMVRIAALIDTRTCDCFPALRSALEEQADYVVRLPADLTAAARVIAQARDDE